MMDDTIGKFFVNHYRKTDGPRVQAGTVGITISRGMPRTIRHVLAYKLSCKFSWKRNVIRL